MNILNLTFVNWYTLALNLNCTAAIGIAAAIFLIGFLGKKCIYHNSIKSLVVDEVSLGIGSNQVKLKYNKKNQEIAYKLWVELSTRKIGLRLDMEKDVIVEVYDSWYGFFAVARELMKEIPADNLSYSSKLIELTERVLNLGLRPHLTMWQAKYRKWYGENINERENAGKSPQQIQEQYPYYAELKQDLLETNSRMIEYKKLMARIAFEQ